MMLTATGLKLFPPAPAAMTAAKASAALEEALAILNTALVGIGKRSDLITLHFGSTTTCKIGCCFR
ncbi:hypothetical protein K4K94_02320 [Phaeobacter inhibens]|uniref:hypothetical protein n=1 Tax=Phaeobacter inhibens TaxID=221822 RepID=UPI0021A4AE06|nr:hypothetical protein [Phaeobacter inhibens]UWS04583.1 hypothetical protein K4K94_02320 [Phaeobacter inhibens]UWS08553.1 hypothetical protein K4K98_02395 [Phaeobacter inhibens]